MGYEFFLFFRYFSQFGYVASCALKKDPVTGNYRGFGFVEFGDDVTANKVLKAFDKEKVRLHCLVV